MPPYIWSLASRSIVFWFRLGDLADQQLKRSFVQIEEEHFRLRNRSCLFNLAREVAIKVMPIRGRDAKRLLLSFGPYRLSTAQRQLELRGAPVRIGARALDILIALALRAGEVVPKNDLMDEIWPGQNVDESVLRAHMAALCKRLGDGGEGTQYVVNVPGRGYCFVAPIDIVQLPELVKSPAVALEQGKKLHSNMPPRHGLPPVRPGIVGRDDAVRLIIADLRRRRFVTIVGAGGMGKTTVAIVVGHRFHESENCDIRFIDLTSIVEPSLVPAVLAASFGLTIFPNDPLPGLIAILRRRQTLLVLDGCERVIDNVALCAARIFQETVTTLILSTSREALNVDGEHIHHLPALRLPSKGQDTTARDAVQFPSVQLFVNKAKGAAGHFQLTDLNASSVAEICRKLDGIPLAIEMAACRVGLFGVPEVRDQVHHRLTSLSTRWRTVSGRHRSLIAMLDWSYDLLSQIEQAVFRRLSIIVGKFRFRTGILLGASEDFTDHLVTEAIASLVSKSLISTSENADGRVLYLLDTTRAYAMSKLEQTKEAAIMARRHAEFYEEDVRSGLRSTLLNRDAALDHVCSEQLDNIRAALIWGFSPSGDPALAVSLVGYSAYLFLDMLFVEECQALCKLAMNIFDQLSTPASTRIQIESAFAIASMQFGGKSDEAKRAFERALTLADETSDLEASFHLLCELHILKINEADFHGALAVAQHSRLIASHICSPAKSRMSEWLFGIALHFIGDQIGASSKSKTSLEDELLFLEKNVARNELNLRLRAIGSHVLSLWLQGYPDQARRIAERSLMEISKVSHPLSLCLLLSWLVSFYIWSGDWDHAEARTKELMNVSETYSLKPFFAIASGFVGEIFVKRGDLEPGITQLRRSIKLLRDSEDKTLIPVFAGTLAEGLLKTAELHESSIMIDFALNAEKANGVTFYTPELLRVKGCILSLLPTDVSREAEKYFLRSLRLAQEQSARSWELRTAVSFAAWYKKVGRLEMAIELLESILKDFTEGFETVDLVGANRLLNDLRG